MLVRTTLRQEHQCALSTETAYSALRTNTTHGNLPKQKTFGTEAQREKRDKSAPNYSRNYLIMALLYLIVKLSYFYCTCAE